MPKLRYDELEPLDITPLVEAVTNASREDLYAGVLAKRIGWEQRRWNFIQGVLYAGFAVNYLGALQRKLKAFFEQNPNANSISALKAHIAQPSHIAPPSQNSDLTPMAPPSPEPDRTAEFLRFAQKTHAEQLVELLGKLDPDELRSSGKLELGSLTSKMFPPIASAARFYNMLDYLRKTAKAKDLISLVESIKKGELENVKI